jgi:acyl-CoA thioesterase
MIAPCLALMMSTGAGAQTSAEIYRKAAAAIKDNDCPTALPLLRKYLQMEHQALSAKPEAKQDIQEQILRCEKWVEESKDAKKEKIWGDPL